MLSAEQIYLSKSSKVIIPRDAKGEMEADRNMRIQGVMTVAKNLKALGFGLSKDLLQELVECKPAFVAQWYEDTVPLCRQAVGAHRDFEPMYPNFPQQVMNMSEADLYLNAMLNYLGFAIADAIGDAEFSIRPYTEKEERPPIDEDEFGPLRWIDVGSGEDFLAVFTRLAGSNGSLSQDDKDILTWFCENRDVAPLLPETVPQKETLALLVASMENPECLVPLVKTATDVLRIACVMSDGDVSLAVATKFGKFSKPQRRFLLQCLDSATNPVEDMMRWKKRWIRLGERLHPGEHAHRYPTAALAFQVIRGKEPYRTRNSQVEAAINTGNGVLVASLLADRPGDFARRLDHILRTTKNAQRIVDTFVSVADRVSTPVLLQCWNHFATRNDVTFRSFYPKGDAAKVQLKEGSMPPTDFSAVQQVLHSLRQTLVTRFASLPPLNRVYIDEELKNHIVPFSQRSASRTLRTVSRGTTFPLPDGDCVRFFCWWKQPKGERVDLDLSGSLFDSDWGKVTDLSYYNLKEGQCCHSGDETSAPQGAAEFIDINLDFALKEMGARYIIMSVLSYSGQKFVDLDECFAGWMMRQHPKSGEIFEPRTVQDKVDITATSRSTVPLIIDAQERRVHWADLSLRSAGQINNAATNRVGMVQMGRSIVNIRKPSLYDLFAMHVDGRGEYWESPDDADTVFGVHHGHVTAFDTDTILSEFLA